jgi:hypothetical protein
MAILWVSLVSFSAINICVASQRVFVVCFVIDSVRKLLDIPSYVFSSKHVNTFALGRQRPRRSKVKPENNYYLKT